MKKFFIVLSILLFISGCHPKFTGDELEKSIAFCRDHGGTQFLQTSDSSDLSYLKCNDKSEIKIGELE